MKRLFYILFIMLYMPLSGQYTGRDNGKTVVLNGSTIKAQFDNIPTSPAAYVPPDPDDYTVYPYITKDFESASIGEYDSAAIYDDWGSNWADSYKTDSYDSTYIEVKDGSQVYMVAYFDNNVGTSPGWTSSAEPEWSEGSGNLFAFPVEDSIPEANKLGDLWWSWNSYIKPGIFWAKGGKTGFTLRYGDDQGVGHSSPDSTEGGSCITMWEWTDTPGANYISSYLYYQIAPYEGGEYAQPNMWDDIDGNQSADTAVFPVGEWFNMTLHIQMNSFTGGGAAIADGFLEGWLNGVMRLRKSNIILINGAGYAAMSSPGFYDAEFAEFFGGDANSNRSTGDEIFWYDDYHLFDVTGDDFPEGDTTSRTVVLTWPWMK